MRDVRETQDRLGRAATYGMHDDGEGISGGSGRFRTAAQLQARKDQRKRYQFEADEEDDQLEDEIDDNLDEIMDVTKRLKALGTAMSSELDSQNSRIDRITNKTDGLDQHLFTNTQRVRSYFLRDESLLTHHMNSLTGSSSLRSPLRTRDAVVSLYVASYRMSFFGLRGLGLSYMECIYGTYRISGDLHERFMRCRSRKYTQHLFQCGEANSVLIEGER